MVKYLYRVSTRFKGHNKTIDSVFIFLNREDAEDLGKSYYKEDMIQDVYIHKYRLSKENQTVFQDIEIWRLQK